MLLPKAKMFAGLRRFWSKILSSLSVPRGVFPNFVGKSLDMFQVLRIIWKMRFTALTCHILKILVFSSYPNLPGLWKFGVYLYRQLAMSFIVAELRVAETVLSVIFSCAWPKKHLFEK
jgi:hypothetical protein